MEYQYKYNGKEWQDELGLNMYDMDMRQYDPAIARWVVQDPVVHHDFSPYSAFDNNPVFWADPSGADSQTDYLGRATRDNKGMFVPDANRGGSNLDNVTNYEGSNSTSSENKNSSNATSGNTPTTTNSETPTSSSNGEAIQSSSDNGYDKNGKEINKNGGDITDYKYDDNGNVIESTPVVSRPISQGEFVKLNGTRGYGVNGFLMSLGAMNDDSLNFVLNLIAIGEIYKGGQLVYMGLTTTSKKTLGYKVLGGASEGTLNSSVYYKSIFGSSQINLLGGTITKLPVITGGSTTYWSSFYGRNAALFGSSRVFVGTTILFNKP